jgi:hypothetical protein
VTFLIGGYFLTKYARRHWPLSLSQLLWIMAWVFLTMMCVASATRIGYVIYPINLALWAWACDERHSTQPYAEVSAQSVSEF